MTAIRVRTPRAALLLAFAASVLSACGDATGPTAIEDTIFVDALGIDLAAFTRTPSGLYYRDVVVGDGTLAVAGTRPVTEIQGWLPNGSVFQSRTVFGGGPDGYVLGAGDVIPGFDEGVTGMRVGGNRILILPADLAYGTDVLVFDVTLQEVQTVG